MGTTLRKPDHGNKRGASETGRLITTDNETGRDGQFRPTLGSILAGVPIGLSAYIAPNEAAVPKQAKHFRISKPRLKALLLELNIDLAQFLQDTRNVVYMPRPASTGRHPQQAITDALRALLVLSVIAEARVEGRSIPLLLPDEIPLKTYKNWRRRMRQVFPQFKGYCTSSGKARAVVFGTFHSPPVPQERWDELAYAANLIGGHAT